MARLQRHASSSPGAPQQPHQGSGLLAALNILGQFEQFSSWNGSAAAFRGLTGTLPHVGARHPAAPFVTAPAGGKAEAARGGEEKKR